MAVAAAVAGTGAMKAFVRCAWRPSRSGPSGTPVTARPNTPVTASTPTATSTAASIEAPKRAVAIRRERLGCNFTPYLSVTRIRLPLLRWVRRFRYATLTASSPASVSAATSGQKVSPFTFQK